MAITEEKFLLFDIDKEAYGLPILGVNEIIGLVDITPIPRTPVYMKGIINLRGRIIPVLDLRLKFGLPEKEPDAQTCIIIVERIFNNKIVFVGLLVDKVAEVVSIQNDEIDLPPQYGQASDDGLFTGVGKIKTGVVMLLNIETVLSGEDILMLHRSASSANMQHVEQVNNFAF